MMDMLFFFVSAHCEVLGRNKSLRLSGPFGSSVVLPV